MSTYTGIDRSGYFEHFGVGHLQGGHSGRYPWGSGEDPYQRAKDFADRVVSLRKQGYSEKEIAQQCNCHSTTELKNYYKIAIHNRKYYDQQRAVGMRADGKTISEISEALGGIPESTVRGYLKPEYKESVMKAANVAKKLEAMVDSQGLIEVGSGAELYLNCTKTTLEEAKTIMKTDGYFVAPARIPQVTNPIKSTTVVVAARPGTEYKDIYPPLRNGEISSVADFRVREDDGMTVEPAFTYPKSMSSKRLKIRWPDEGGADKDGLVEIRRGCDDLSLGESVYSQVRILVDDTHYIKGMAVYSDAKDWPPGVDVMFNTSKDRSQPVMGKVLKAIKKDDKNNPFGSAIKSASEGGQYYYIDKNGKKQLGLINKRSDEGDWQEWKDTLPSQFLSKQPMQLIERQLSKSEQDHQQMFKDICSLTNPTIKRFMLEEFASKCDTAAVQLKGASFPGQKYAVILPGVTLGEKEVYAPNYPDGTILALVRYPHGGTFEIPIVRVNNKNKECQAMLGKRPTDAIAIHPKAASILSGADFDGDTVMMIPCNSPDTDIRIVSKPQLKGLIGFNEIFHTKYAKTDDMIFMKGEKKVQHADGTVTVEKYDNTQMEMGKISNLITDMTLKGANEDDIAAAVRHSMVVIDAGKHELNYKQSEADNNIPYLKKRWQGRIDPKDGKYHEGASTLISRSSREVDVDPSVGQPKIDIHGDLIIRREPRSFIGKDGKQVDIKVKSTEMAETKDARTLSSGTLVEERYAKYANFMKDLARQARLEQKATGILEYNPQSAKIFATEVTQIKAAIAEAEMNAPREKMAQIYANAQLAAMKEANPNLKKQKDELKKLGTIALKKGRDIFNAQRKEIVFTARQWEAIQSGAIHDNVLSRAFKYCNKTQLTQLSMPFDNSKRLSDTQLRKIKAMLASPAGYSPQQIASAVGCSVSSVNRYRSDEKELNRMLAEAKK